MGYTALVITLGWQASLQAFKYWEMNGFLRQNRQNNHLRKVDKKKWLQAENEWMQQILRRLLSKMFDVPIRQTPQIFSHVSQFDNP